MWNNVFYQGKGSYNPYTTTKRKQELAKLSKYKLLIMLISRYTYRVMKESISHIDKITKIQALKIQKMERIMKNNIHQACGLSFQKLKENTIYQRSKEKTIRNISVLLQRMLKYKLKKTFASILLFGQRKNQIVMRNTEHMRKMIFCRKIEKLFENKKRNHLNKMQQYLLYIKKLHKKVRMAGIIGKQYIKNVKQACFNRLAKNSTSSKPLKTFRQTNQNKQLKIKLNDMQVQLQNKNESISRLEQQIQQLKMDQPLNNYNSFSQYTVLNNALNKSRSNYYNKAKRGHNQSLDSGLDFSLGSILGNSFSLNKSRSKQTRKGDSVVSVDCNCGYKQKYIKYKNSNQSLKNQLEIVKEQLQVAKDLNDHFTNEIRQYFGGQKDEIQLDKLRTQTRQLQRQREELRMKVAKYQHHITTLKSQFKTKIQDLYRKVKKQR